MPRRPTSWEPGTQLVTSNHVLGESWTWIRRRAGHADAVRFLDRIEASPRLRVVHVDDELEGRAWTWLRRHDERDVLVRRRDELRADALDEDQGRARVRRRLQRRRLPRAPAVAHPSRRTVYKRTGPEIPFSSTGPISAYDTGADPATSTTAWLTTTSPAPAWSATREAMFHRPAVVVALDRPTARHRRQRSGRVGPSTKS